jgi:alkylhydroperoxidase/carboxymuconolactone decarboxylase family protein YurZ
MMTPPSSIPNDVAPNGEQHELGCLYDAPVHAAATRMISPALFDAVAGYWAAASGKGKHQPGSLKDSTKELICLAVHASASLLNEAAVQIHVRKALDAGASQQEIVEVLAAIAPLGQHSFGFAVPLLLSELEKAGAKADLPEISSEAEAIKNEFIARRGYWTEAREQLARLSPDLFRAYMTLSSAPWVIGTLEPKIVELIFVAIDCSVAHMHEPGFRIHVRNALKAGASAEEILEVVKLVAALGTRSFVIGTNALAAADDGKP